MAHRHMWSRHGHKEDHTRNGINRRCYKYDARAGETNIVRYQERY